MTNETLAVWGRVDGGSAEVEVPAQRMAGPLWFRFTDMNPLTGKAYLVSGWDDLPYSVVAVVERCWGLAAHEWAGLVASGDIVDVVGGREYPLPYTLDLPLREPRTGRAPAGTCPDCWGTGVEIDRDGSMTGTVGASFTCICAGGTVVGDALSVLSGASRSLGTVQYTWVSA